jgi:glutathione S-transferase
MKLYHSTSSPNSRRVWIFVAEKGISIPLQPVDLGEKEQFSDWFAAINPRQQLSALVLDDATTVAEVPAIWRFLEETYPERPLLGGDATSRALVTMWKRRAELDGFAPIMEAVRNAAAGLKGRARSGPHGYDQIPGLIERSRRRVADFYSDLENAGARLLFLPPYSPDFNPIEMAFSKIKALLRKAAARTVDELWSVVARCPSAFTAKECRHYFEAAGYDPE